MRLWTLHPKYLDAKGLTALWRESLLARAVLKGKTKGYVNHPQLIRFRDSGHPIEYIEAYLRHIHTESVRRNYNFDTSKLVEGQNHAPINETRGQLFYEWEHLKDKLLRRDPKSLAPLKQIKEPDPHPLFTIIPGPVQDWERR